MVYLLDVSPFREIIISIKLFRDNDSVGDTGRERQEIRL